jgi:hypothetical protein
MSHVECSSADAVQCWHKAASNAGCLLFRLLFFTLGARSEGHKSEVIVGHQLSRSSCTKEAALFLTKVQSLELPSDPGGRVVYTGVAQLV